jgi:hypothetical protein
LSAACCPQADEGEGVVDANLLLMVVLVALLLLIMLAPVVLALVMLWLFRRTRRD